MTKNPLTLNTGNAQHLVDPTPVYVPGWNFEAQLLAVHLTEAGIPAVAIEDLSTAGITAVGPAAGIHRPQVFVGKRDVAAALDFIRKWEKPEPTDSRTEPFCYHCGAEVSTDSSTCAACGSALEIPEDSSSDAEVPANGPPITSFFQSFRVKYAAVMVAMLLAYCVAEVLGVVTTVLSHFSIRH